MLALRLLLVLLLFVAPSLPQDDAPLEVTAEQKAWLSAQLERIEASQRMLPEPWEGATVDCPTCVEGLASVACGACDGHGQLVCYLCGFVLRQWQRHGFASDELTQDTRPWSAESVYAPLEQLHEIYPINSTTLRPGLLECTQKSRHEVKGPKGDCSLCKKGELACKACRKSGWIKCDVCRGKGRVDGSCLDCAGKGVLPDPMADHASCPAVCGWCRGKGAARCPEFERGGHDKDIGMRDCQICAGRDSAYCFSCLGVKKDVCLGCGGSGKDLGSLFDKGRPKKCKRCKGKGLSDCMFCGGKGKSICFECPNRGEQPATCQVCAEDAVVACPGCFRGSTRFWRVTAEMLRERGEGQRGLDYATQIPRRLGTRAIQREAFREHTGFDFVTGEWADEEQLEKAIDDSDEETMDWLEEFEASLAEPVGD